MPRGPATPAPAAGAASLQSLSEAFASVAEAVKPSVVFIKSGKRNDDEPGQRQPQFQLPPGFEESHARGCRRCSSPSSRRRPAPGFIVSRDGYILTNDHVVDGSDVVTVRLLDRREFKAKVVGTDASTDLAVLKIDATNLTPAPLGDSDAARVGEWVLAVGNPLGENLTFTVTSGIISAKGRTLAAPQRQRPQHPGLHTDRRRDQPGQLGWPAGEHRRPGARRQLGDRQPHRVLLRLRLRDSHQPGAPGDGPDHLPRRSPPLGARHRRARTPPPMTRPTSACPTSAVCWSRTSASDNSAAKQAGLEPGDIIITVDGKPVEYVGQLQQRIAFRKPGETVKVEVARKGGVRKTYDVKLQAMPGAAAVADRSGGASEDVANESGAAMGKLGVTVTPVTQDDAARFELTAGAARLDGHRCDRRRPGLG